METLSVQQLTTMINHSKIIYVDPEKDPEMFNSLFAEFLGLCYAYVCKAYCTGSRYYESDGKKSDQYGDFYDELYICLKNCLKYFNPDMGEFINYFNKAFSKIIKSLEKRDYKEAPQRERGIDATIGNYIRTFGISCSYSEMKVSDVIEIAQEIGIDPEDVERYIMKKLSQTVLPQYIQIDEENVINVIDTVAAEVEVAPLFMQTENVKAIMEVAQRIYDGSCDTQKPIISLRFTADVLSAIDIELHDVRGFDIMSDFLISIYYDEDRILLPNEISAVLQMYDSHVSRVYGDYKRQLKDELDKALNG